MRLRMGNSLLQVKKSVLIIVGAVFIFMGGLFYLVLGPDSSFSSSSELKTFKVMVGRGDLGVLEQRLEKLESELFKNRLMLGQVRETVQKLTAMQSDLYLPSKSDLTPRNRSYVLLSTPQCLSNRESTLADHSMLDVYEKEKFENPDGGVWKQGWNIEYQPNQWTSDKKLRVFVVPHSHNDPGWLKTFDKYFNDQTRHILNNMLNKLKEDNRWRFIWAEVSFLAPWWETLDEDSKDQVRRYLADGQLEIVTGGWVMNDEASTHYFAMIEQMVEGHQWLERNMDFRPRNGWAIDPFGLSPTMAYLLRRMGLDNMVIQRVHYTIKKYLAKNKGLEFLWRQSWDHNHTSDILCHLMPFFSYDIPHTCGPDPKICCQFDFKRLPGNKVNCPWRVPPVAITDKNVADRAWLLLDQYRKKAQLFRSNVLLVPLGDDFRFDKPNEWDNQFRNYVKLFDYMNNREDWHVEAQLGTLDDYFVALREEVPVDSRNLPAEFPSLSGDFFVYADREDHYWSGFYASRPFFKNMDRVLEATIRGAEILYSFLRSDPNPKVSDDTFVTNEMMKVLVEARRSLGLFQHHDGITGTAKDIVMIDYATKLYSALLSLEKLIAQCSGVLLSKQSLPSSKIVFLEMDEKRPQYNAMPQKTMLQFSLEIREWKVVLLNSLSHSRKEIITVHTSTPNVEVRNSTGHLVLSQISPSFAGFRMIKDRYELSFLAEVSGISLTTFTIQTSVFMTSSKASISLYNHETIPQSMDFLIQQKEVAQEFSIKSFYYTAIFSGADGMLRRIVTTEDGAVTETRIQFMIYGTRPKGRDRSGAYLFLPDGAAQDVKYKMPRIRTVEGPLHSEVVVFLPNVEHHIRLRNSPGLDGVGIEIYNIVDITREFNKEFVMRLYTNISNQNQEFYTDLNGFQIIKRKMLDKLPLQANVYPMPTMAFIQDNVTRLSLLSAQPLGVTSLKQGWLEVFLDRRLNQDDNRGLQQGITDNKRTPSTFRLLIERSNLAKSKKVPLSQGIPSLLAHHVSLGLLHPMFTMIKLHPKNPIEDPAQNQQWEPIYTPLGQELPCDVHLLNLRTLQAPASDPKLIRPDNFTALFLHRLGFDCSFKSLATNCSLSTGKVSIASLFPGYFGPNVEETSLSLMYSGSVFSKDSYLQLPSMEVVTLKLQRR